MKTDAYLRRYRNRYRAVKGEDGCCNLATRHKDRDGTRFEVYCYSDTELAVCLPRSVAIRRLRERPGTFTLRQDAVDGVCLSFPSDRLHELADALGLKRRRQVNERERQRLSDMSKAHSPFRKDTIVDGQFSAQESTIAPEPDLDP